MHPGDHDDDQSNAGLMKQITFLMACGPEPEGRRVEHRDRL